MAGSAGFIAIDKPFMSTDTYRVERPMAGDPVTVTRQLEGRGYVPMFRAVCEAIGDGLPEHPMRPLGSTIAVLDTMDEVRRQIALQRTVSL